MALYEYPRGCDFDVVDEMPSQDVFDSTYWNRRPLLVRNGTKAWRAQTAWSTKAKIISAFRGSGFGSAWFRSSDEHASFFMHEFFRKSTHTGAQRERMDVAHFLCRHVCNAPESDDQTYLFDRDDWRVAAPQLEADTVAPPRIAAHYDDQWHERWSKYLLITAEGSGINFHRHTNAFNGLVVGRKRWFLYPPGVEPPHFTMGMLPWFRKVYSPQWAPRGEQRAGRDGLEQCMQAEGDLLYVPQHWWHATIALGEGIGLSGQFVRRLNQILDRIKLAEREGRSLDLLADLRFVRQHRDEVEGDLVMHTATNVAGLEAQLGLWDEAEASALLALELIEQHGDSAGSQRGMAERARTVLRLAQQQRQARG